MSWLYFCLKLVILLLPVFVRDLIVACIFLFGDLPSSGCSLDPLLLDLLLIQCKLMIGVATRYIVICSSIDSVSSGSCFILCGQMLILVKRCIDLLDLELLSQLFLQICQLVRRWWWWRHLDNMSVPVRGCSSGTPWTQILLLRHSLCRFSSLVTCLLPVLRRERI